MEVIYFWNRNNNMYLSVVATMTLNFIFNE